MKVNIAPVEYAIMSALSDSKRVSVSACDPNGMLVEMYAKADLRSIANIDEKFDITEVTIGIDDTETRIYIHVDGDIGDIGEQNERQRQRRARLADRASAGDFPRESNSIGERGGVMPNDNLKEFWRGYRNAKIYAYLWVIEHKNELVESVEKDEHPEQFVKGFIAGVEGLQVELAALIDRDRSNG